MLETWQVEEKEEGQVPLEATVLLHKTSVAPGNPQVSVEHQNPGCWFSPGREEELYDVLRLLHTNKKQKPKGLSAGAERPLGGSSLIPVLGSSAACSVLCARSLCCSL